MFRNLRETHSLDNQSETGSNRGRRPLSHHETTDDDSSDYSLTDDESLEGTIKLKVNQYIYIYFLIISYSIIYINYFLGR